MINKILRKLFKIKIIKLSDSFTWAGGTYFFPLESGYNDTTKEFKIIDKDGKRLPLKLENEEDANLVLRLFIKAFRREDKPIRRMYKSEKSVLRLVLIILTAATLLYLSFYYTYDLGYYKGAERGVSVALDSVQTIIHEQTLSDSTRTRLIIINPDTIEYILSPTILIEP